MEITNKIYNKFNNEWWVGRIVITKKEIRNCYFIIPKNTRLTVTRKYKGFELVSFGCGTCGVIIRINRVPKYDLELDYGSQSIKDLKE